MSDTSLHKIYNISNSKPRNDVSGVLQGYVEVNSALAEKHVIQEPESSRKNITRTVFEKMAKIEDIISKRDENNYLSSIYVQKETQCQSLKNELKELTHSKEDDEIINDFIGG